MDLIRFPLDTGDVSRWIPCVCDTIANACRAVAGRDGCAAASGCLDEAGLKREEYSIKPLTRTTESWVDPFACEGGMSNISRGVLLPQMLKSSLPIADSI